MILLLYMMSRVKEKMHRDRSYNRPLTTTYYDKDTHVPHRGNYS